MAQRGGRLVRGGSGGGGLEPVLRWCSNGGGRASGEAELPGGGFSEEELHHGSARCPHERMRRDEEREFLSPIATIASRDLLSFATAATRRRLLLSTTTTTIAAAMAASASSCKVIDSHLHVWATPQQAKEEYPYFPGQEPTLRGDDDFLLECMSEAGVDGALIVQPINHMFDHSLVTSTLKKYPSKFIGCCLANPADDGSGIKQLEHLIVQENTVL